MTSRSGPKEHLNPPAWLTERGLDLSLYPIDGVLKQTLSANDEDFRSGCVLLMLMCDAGRVEAGVFLLGLLKRHPDNYGRLTNIVDALASFRCSETVDALASELRRVRGSSLTRAYLRRIIKILDRFPADLAGETIQKLSSDPLVGVRFRQRLKALISDPDDDWRFDG